MVFATLLPAIAIDVNCSGSIAFLPIILCKIAEPLRPLDRPKFLLPDGKNSSEVNGIHFISFNVNFVPGPRIQPSIFESFPNLRTLKFYRNQISGISKTDFLHANELQTLDLSFNRLERIPFQAFSHTWDLIDLDLANNQIHVLDDYAFDGPIKLKNLALHGNRLRTITRLALANLPELRVLQLQRNSIVEMEDDALNFPKLEILYLGENKLETLSESLFVHTPALRHVELQQNNLRLMNGALDHLRNLYTLYLSDNRIDDIDLKKLTKLENLHNLHLANTGMNLNLLRVTAAASKSKITYLDLSGNGIRNGIFIEKLKLFPNLKRLYV